MRYAIMIFRADMLLGVSRSSHNRWPLNKCTTAFSINDEYHSAREFLSILPSNALGLGIYALKGAEGAQVR
jgi:hypothetical protein